MPKREGLHGCYMDACQRSKYQPRTPMESYALEMGDVGSSHGTGNSELCRLRPVRKLPRGSFCSSLPIKAGLSRNEVDK